MALRLWKDAERAELRALAIDPHYALAALDLLTTRLNATGDVDSARRAFDGFPEGINFIDSVVDRGWTLHASSMCGFISTSSKDVSPMLSKLSRRKWPMTIVGISSSLPGASPFACWQGRLRQPNPREKKRCRYSRPDSESGQMTLSR